MAVTIPTSMETEDVNSQNGVLFGIPIEQAGLRTLANNHNFIGGNYAPAVGHYSRGGGQGTTAAVGGAWQGLVATSIPRQLDGRGLVCSFRASNLNPNWPSITPQTPEIATVRLKVGSVVGATITIPADSAENTYLVEVLSVPASSGSVAMLQYKMATAWGAETLKIHSISFHWKQKTGSQSDTPTASGFVYASSGDFAPTEPLTVEEFNRLRGGPRTIFEAMPQAAASLIEPLWGADTTTKTTRTLMGFLPIYKRRNTVKIRFDCIASGSLLEIWVPDPTGSGPGTFYSVTPSVSDSADAWDLDPTAIAIVSTGTVDFSAHPILTMVHVYLTSPDVTRSARVYSVSGVLV